MLINGRAGRGAEERLTVTDPDNWQQLDTAMLIS